MLQAHQSHHQHQADENQQTGSSIEMVSGSDESTKGRIITYRMIIDMEHDIDDFFKKTKCLEQVPKSRKTGASDFDITLPIRVDEDDLQEKKKSLLNMLLSFLVYRPDVGYFWNMSYIAGTIMHYCEEAEAFICFANFVH